MNSPSVVQNAVVLVIDCILPGPRTNLSGVCALKKSISIPCHENQYFAALINHANECNYKHYLVIIYLLHGCFQFCQSRD